MTTYILGAGPTGLAIADGLIDARAGDFVVFEQGANLGGQAQTVRWKGVGDHDLGPHKIFSLNKNLIHRVESLLPGAEWLTKDKVSSIFIKGHYLCYPPSPLSLAGVFGLSAFLKMVAGYGFARMGSLFSSRNPVSFEDDLVARLGGPLYEVLFKPIAEKLWGDPKCLDVKLSGGRVQTPSLLEVIGRLLKIKKNSEFEALTFRYPKGGLGRLWEAIQTKAQGPGRFFLGHAITGLRVEAHRVRQIRFSSKETHGVIDLAPDDQVVSTLPLAYTTQILSQALPPHFPQLAGNVVVLNDLLLVFLHVDKPSLLRESWVFIPDPEIVFHRLSEQESFDPAMTPNGSIVCCEIMSSTRRPLAEKTDEELSVLALEGLAAMGYGDFKVLSKRVLRLPKSYPVFATGFEAGLSELINTLDQFENFRSIGRQGAFNYIGTLDAMDIGYGFADWLANGRSRSWQDERKRTNHYPVLD